MERERYLIENRHFEPLGWILIGVSLVIVEGYNFTAIGVQAGGVLMFGVGIGSLLMGAFRWQNEETIQNPDDVSPVKHLVLAVLLLVILGSLAI